MERATAGLQEAQQRCNEAAEHVASGSYLGAIGALVNLEERVRYVATILTVLRDLEAARNQAPLKFTEKGEGN